MFAEVNPAFLIASLFFIVSLCYMCLCIVTLKNSTKSKLRDDYLTGGICLFIHSLCYGLMTITANEVLCRIFWAVGFCASSLLFARWLVFSSNMVAIKHHPTKLVIKVASAGSLIISGICVFSNDAVFVTTKYGVQFSYYNSPYFAIALISLSIIVFAFLAMFLRWWRESDLKRNRIQALLFLVLSAFIAPIGFATDLIIPIFTQNTAIPLATVCFLPISMPLLISMLKYKTLSITVPNASGYVFNTVTIPTLVLDLQNNISLENKAALNFLGCSVIGKNISEILLSNEKTLEQSFFDRDFSNEKVSVDTPIGIRICDMLLAVENDKYGDILCKVALLRDITENEQKDNMLKAALEQAHAASKAKSSFLSNMSHEIRTPMNAIIGMTTIGKMSNTIEKKDDALNKISGASTHLLGVINDILDMSKIEADKLELSDASFDFEKMLQNVAEIISFRVDERRQKFYVNIGNGIPRTLIGDDQRLSQVIANLLSNAVKFTPEEGTIRLDSQVIAMDDDTCRLQISVEDTGIGISDEQKSRLFHSFEQAEADTARKFGGTGLGLAISKRIVELMGGSIWVDSEPGKGSKFSFTVLLQHNSAKEEHSPEADMSWRSIRILIADNEPEIINLFAAFSQVRNIDCTVATNSKQALDALKTNGIYDICFLDLQLLGANDDELTRMLEAKTSVKSIVLIHSSIGFEATEEKAHTLSISKFMPKPLFPSSISDMINMCMGLDSVARKETDSSDNFSACTILLAEDIEINREIVMALLEPMLLNIECAENGVQALELFAKAPEKYDLIFMDVQMPEMDGYEATQRIRALDVPQAKTVPIIAMTANVFREDIEKCLEVGMNGHVGKPLDFDEVLGQLRKYLNASKEGLG